MWLLNAHTRRLENFLDDRQMDVAYAILSHTWGREEVSFDDIHHDHAKEKDGYRKIHYTCKQALKDDIAYVWLDTCCIDKKSSAELSEAINSMYRWYYNARVCYAFLEDVLTPMKDLCDGHNRSTFSKMKEIIAASRWFTRGWTLQELIAPYRVEFYDMVWNPLGVKKEVVRPLSKITGISEFVLHDRNQLSRASIAQRMAWASGRTTSRLEDEAYCLLGLFDVNIPLMYGEGKKAFVRLQEEIIQTRSWEDQDDSILAFKSMNGDILASSPGDFRQCHKVVRTELAGHGSLELSRRGLQISLLGTTLPATGQTYDEDDRVLNDATIMLDCAKSGGHSRFGLRLRPRPPIDRAGRPRVDAARAELIYDRLPGLLELSTLDLVGFSRMEVTIARKPFSWPRVLDHLVVECPDAKLHLDSTADAGESVGFTDSFSKQHWTNQTGDQIGATSETKWERGRIKMRLGSDGRLFADFKLHFQTPSSDNVPDEYLDTCVHVEADPEPLSPVLVVHCWRGTSHSVKVSAQEKLRVLRVGSSRTFKLDAGESLQVKAGLILEAGVGVWRLNLARKKPEIIYKSGGGTRDTPTALVAEQQACPRSDHRRPCCSESAVQSTIANVEDVRALLQELTHLRDNLRSLYQEPLSGAENIVQRQEGGRSPRSELRGKLAEGDIAPSASINVMREREDTKLKTTMPTTDSGSVDALAEHNKTIGGEQPAVAEAQIEVKTFMSFMHSGPYYELEAKALDGPRPKENAAGTPIEAKAFVSFMHSESFNGSEAEDTNGSRPTEDAAVAHLGMEPVGWIWGSGPFHELEANVTSDPVTAAAADFWDDGTLPPCCWPVEHEMMVAPVMNQWYEMIYNSDSQLRHWHAAESSSDGGSSGDDQLTRCSTDARKGFNSDELLPWLNATDEHGHEQEGDEQVAQAGEVEGSLLVIAESADSHMGMSPPLIVIEDIDHTKQQTSPVPCTPEQEQPRRGDDDNVHLDEYLQIPENLIDWTEYGHMGEAEQCIDGRFIVSSEVAFGADDDDEAEASLEIIVSWRALLRRRYWDVW